MFDIHDWNEAYLVLKHRAEEVRGFIELDPGTPELVRWPRTIGADIVVIVALVDPHVKRLRAAEAIQRRWGACLADVERDALAAPGEIYRHNRAFWRCLVAVCVHLASVEAPLPDPIAWMILVNELGNVLRVRNVGPKGDGPFKHFDNIKTFDDLWIAQYNHLLQARGFDERDIEPTPSPYGPYGMSYGAMRVPRTTNADVVALVDYWGPQFDDVKEVMGRDTINRGWRAALVDVDAIARKGDPKAVYPKNNAFWRELKDTALHVSVADQMPSKWDIAVDAVKHSVQKLPERISGGAKKVASEVAELAGDAAHGIGRIANKAGQGLFSGLGAPLLIGGGLLGLYLISRSRRDKPEKKEE